jgi:3-oxoacyl-[acyl-carrier protein] reductase
MFKLDGKRAVVTGATGGIGAEIARALHRAGASVLASGTIPKNWRRWRASWASG